MGFSSDRGARLPVDHAAQHPPGAIGLANLATLQDGAVQRREKERER
ncbi:hypothetical protein M2164_001061 [Streptomyces sp. SAI-208]|nr:MULTISPECIES: hypothetical protein [unclassified Streptomyces]MDH6514584.1 hypothetical protein [Streptomyces sp. SAI-090]MDH6605426.1 hypothetical protein [Streptomyces sp. SAI-208]MDH6621333.1 hypothetical protein [Streptomyces sp. SAI-135]